MRIQTDANRFYASERVQASAAKDAKAASFSAALTNAMEGTSSVRQADFSNMTRQEMFDWMNDQIRSGKMSLDESSPFLAMTVKISAATGQPVDMASDTTRINFFEKARMGIEGAISRNDQDLARRLQAAIEIMRDNSRQTGIIDARA